jgi:hypothetical protein
MQPMAHLSPQQILPNTNTPGIAEKQSVAKKTYEKIEQDDMHCAEILRTRESWHGIWQKGRTSRKHLFE